jgi:holo-[acyl-carrier protein] synthase
VGDWVGTDIVSVPRIDAVIRERGPAFLRRWFTAKEIAYCTRKAVPSRHFAARIAAKEAVVKALPVSWEGPLPWRFIEIVHEAQGRPLVRLGGGLTEVAQRAGVLDIRISLSHCDEFATAVALVTTRATAVGGTAGEGTAGEDTAGEDTAGEDTAGEGTAGEDMVGGTEDRPVNRDRIEAILQEWQRLRDPEADPELEAVRGAVLLEDVFGVTLSDDEIDLAVLSDPDAVERLLARRESSSCGSNSCGSSS